jgi:hypothetical protein
MQNFAPPLKAQPVSKEITRPQVRSIRSLNAMTIEDSVLTTLWYGLFALYCLQMISFGALFALTFVYIVRVFTIRHEKTHIGIKRYTGWMQFFTNYYSIFHTPYQEPVTEKQRKHLAHHSSHMKANLSKKSAYVDDPHQILEDGPWYKALFFNFFYEETMFVLDWKRNSGLRSDRAKMLALSTVGIATMIVVAGLENFLVLFICYRFWMAQVWFLFSFVLHSEPYYSMSANLFHRVLSPQVLRATEWIFGASNSTVVLFHKFHHDNPNKFYQFAGPRVKMEKQS